MHLINTKLHGKFAARMMPCIVILYFRINFRYSLGDFFFLMFQTGVVVNIGLGWLNLMPIPPLDGSKILWGVLPPKLGFQYMQLERYGFLVLILLLMTGALGYVLYPLIQFSVNTVFSLIVLS